jgi:hypothetical protein
MTFASMEEQFAQANCKLVGLSVAGQGQGARDNPEEMAGLIHVSGRRQPMLAATFLCHAKS